MTTTPSLAARVHAALATSYDPKFFRKEMTAADQLALFGIVLNPPRANVTIKLLADSQFSVRIVDSTIDFHEQTLTLEAIQGRIEREEEEQRGGGYDDDFGSSYIMSDGYRTFDRDSSAVVVVENKKLGRRHSIFGEDLARSKDSFARYHGYADWAEMRALAPEGDREEDWTISWLDGHPEQCRRRSIAKLSAESVWLGQRFIELCKTDFGSDFRKKQEDLFDFGWRQREPEAYAARQAECDELRRKQIEHGEQLDEVVRRQTEIADLLDMYTQRDRMYDAYSDTPERALADEVIGSLSVDEIADYRGDDPQQGYAYVAGLVESVAQPGMNVDLAAEIVEHLIKKEQHAVAAE